MKTRGHLWSGSWREDAERAQREREAAELQLSIVHEEEPEEPHAHPPIQGSRPPIQAVPSPVTSAGDATRQRRRVALFAVVPVIAAVGLGAYLLGHDSSKKSGAESGGVAPAALPASTAKTLNRKAGQTRASAIYIKDSPGVVSIRTGTGSGTGFLVKDLRTIVTNAHVVEDASSVTIKFGADGRELTGRVLGSDPSSDLAVVQIDAGAAPADAKPLEIADSDQVVIGQSVIAIGNPFGLDRTETQGIVSSTGRQITAPNGFAIDGAIQTDAAINPGNSGGPLLDDTGRVIGVNSQIETGSGSNGNVGIGFAVPSNSIRSIVPQLALGKHIAHAWLGVETSGSSGGATLARIVPGGPAENAGLRAGDIVTGIDSKPVANADDVSRIINSLAPGKKIAVKVLRGGQAQTITVTLGNRPATTPTIP